MAGVEDWQIVFLSHFIDRRKQADKVLFGIDILLAVSGEQDILAFFKAQSSMNIARFDLFEIVMQHLRHRGACHIGTLLRQPRIGKIAARVLAVGEVDVGNDVDDTTIGFLGKALVLAAVTRFHVEDRDVQALCADDAQTGVGIAEYQYRIGLNLSHQLIAFRDDIAHRLAEIGADRIEVNVGIVQRQILEEYAVEVVVVVLTRVREDGIKISARLIDHSGKTDDFGARADDDQEL